jgi:hypothetical protein
VAPVPDSCNRHSGLYRSRKFNLVPKATQVKQETAKLCQFDFTLKHWPGHLNSKADLLFCHPDHDMGQNDNQNVIILKKEWFRGLELSEINKDLLRKIK